jgi:hypothetical protein
VTSRIGLATAAGLLASLLFLSLVRGLPNGSLAAFFAPLPLMVAGLGLGQWAVLLGGAAGAMAGAAVAGTPTALTFAAMAVLPALVVANRALLCRTTADGGLEWYPPGRILAWLTLAAVGLFALGAAALPDHADGVRGWMTEVARRTLEMLGDEVAPDQREAMAASLARVLPGMMMGVWLLMAAANAVVGQALLAAGGKARRPSPAYCGLDLPDWSAAAAVGAVLVAAVAGGGLAYLAANIAAVALLPFAVMGVSIAHAHLAARPRGMLGLVVLYGVLVVALVWMLIPAAGLGLARFVQTRMRRAPAGRGKEE